MDFTGLSNVEIGDDVTFDEITLTFTAKDNLFANGHAVTIGSNVDMTNNISLYGGGNGEDSIVDSTNLTVLSGTYSRIYGGSLNGSVTGSTNLYIGGNVNDEENASAHANTYRIYAGGNNDTVGSTNCTFTGSAQANYLFGGSFGDSAKIIGSTNLTFNGGSVYGIYGGNESSATVNGINVTVEGGTMAQLIGANNHKSVNCNVYIEILGGIITRRIYGGCYNEVSDIGVWSGTEYHVNGTITMKISSEAQIIFSSSELDRSFYVCSRYNQAFSDENCILIYQDEKAYNTYSEKLGTRDWPMRSYISGAKPYDDYQIGE